MIKLNRPNCPNPNALKTNYKHPVNKAALQAASFDKCMYCESKVPHIDFGDVEHIKPKSLFPELAFNWENLGFVCAKCNHAKRDQWHALSPYINPYDENPKEHIAALGCFVWHRQGSERGEATLRDIQLNRPELLEQRDLRIKAITKMIDNINRTKDPKIVEDLKIDLKKESADDTPYSLVVKAAIAALL